ncbi:hypothetical protein V8C40DRAFT_92592 [Trichoderma camerunense]
MLLRASVIVECTLGITLYNYSCISSISNTFNIGTIEEITISKYSEYTSKEDIRSEDPFTRWWNDTGSGLPDVHPSLRFPKYSHHVHQVRGKSLTQSIRITFHLMVFSYSNLEEFPFILDRIVMSLTDMVRQGISMQIAQGKTSQTVVFIRVRWRWLILPLAVHFLAAIALVGTIIGRSRDVPLWKGSALAVLYHSVDKDRVLGTQVRNLEELDEVKSIQVMLEKKE